MTDQQFQESVRLLFGIGTVGRAILEELQLRYARPFHENPYRMAKNVGAQEVIAELMETANG